MKKKLTRRPRRRITRRPRRVARRAGEYASLKEMHEFGTMKANTAFKDYQVSLARFERATNVAHGYREFKITKVEYLFTPKFDSYTLSVGTPIPYLYAMVDKDGAFGGINGAEPLNQAGCKPRRLEGRTIRYAFKPSTLGYAYDRSNGTNVFSKPQTGWLSCNKNNVTGSATSWLPSSVDHLGIVWIVDGDPKIEYEVKVVAHFQFRKPSWQSSSVTGPGAIQLTDREDVVEIPPVVDPKPPADQTTDGTV